MNGQSSDHEAIRNLVRSINDHWLARRYDLIGDLLADGAVIAPPDFATRVRGRDAYVQSYRDYDAAAATIEFSADDPEIDMAGDTAIAVSPFRVTYEIDGTTHRESGHDILVLSRSSGEWKVIWRTMQTKPSDR